VVLYNSPLAVALIVVTIVFVVAGAAAQHARLYRLAGLLPDDAVAPFRHHVIASAGAVLLVLAFWLLLGFFSVRQTLMAPSSVPVPAGPIEWSPVAEPAPRIALDRFELPSSASSKELLRER
jgi:hypothetical protein